MIRLYPILIFILVFNSSFGQSDYRPGYVIQNSGDTLKGWVIYHESNDQHSECNFKLDQNAEATLYKPEILKGYGFTEYNYAYLTKEIVRDTVREVKFARILAPGKITLLKIDKLLYLEDSEKMLHLLTPVEETFIKNGRTYIGNDAARKRGVLLWKMSDRPDLKGNISNIELSEKHLVRLFEKYNDSGSLSKSQKSKLPGVSINIGPSIEYVSNHLMNTDDLDHFFTINQDQFGRDKGISAGVSLQISSPKVSEKIWLHLDFIYQEKSFGSSTSSVYAPTLWGAINTVFVDYTSIKIPILFSYHFTRYQKKLTPFFEAGISLSTILKSSSFTIQEVADPFGSTIEVSRLDFPFVINKSTYPFSIGAGMSYKISNRFSALLRCRFTYGLSSISSPFTTKPAYEQSLSAMATLTYSFAK